VLWKWYKTNLHKSTTRCKESVLAIAAAVPQRIEIKLEETTSQRQVPSEHPLMKFEPLEVCGA
jgi:hypothetical protein